MRTFGTKGNAERFVTGSGNVVAELFLASPCDCKDVDYDVRNVELVVRYAVLRS